LGKIGGQANGPIPHLDAVPAMDDNNNFYWVSTRNYPEVWENLQHGIFDPVRGVVPVAAPVMGDIYVRALVWIVMDQEINKDGSILFYVNAQFDIPPGPVPRFTNISMATRNPNGSFSNHPNAVQILREVNNAVNPTYLRYGPSSLGTNGLELYFTVLVHEPVVAGLFVAKRTSPDEPFGVPERIPIPSGCIQPEAPTLSADGNLMMITCSDLQIYSMQRSQKSNVSV